MSKLFGVLFNSRESVRVTEAGGAAVQMPPPSIPAVFLTTFELITLTGPPSLSMPPPFSLAEFFDTSEFVRVVIPASLAMPPPSAWVALCRIEELWIWTVAPAML